MNYLSIEDFLNSAENIPLLDVRSEGEFEQGHIPGAICFPLLNNEERKLVGTCYKNEGNEAAVILGYRLVGGKFADYILKAIELSPSREVALHCWRGGMRSRIMADLLTNAGFKVFILKGGYKTFRNYVLKCFEEEKNIRVIGGLTGSGKTVLLNALRKEGEQVIDLEGIAHHKGSAFGALGQLPQFSQEHFENVLALEWKKTDSNKVLWLENESRKIGANCLPDKIYTALSNAPVYEIEIPHHVRFARLAKEYSHFDKQLLISRTQSLRKRLGDLRLRKAIDHLEHDELTLWVQMMMDYYDKSYRYGQELRPPHERKLIQLEHPSDVKTFLENVNAS